jgi:hypothetical protein
MTANDNMECQPWLGRPPRWVRSRPILPSIVHGKDRAKLKALRFLAI